LAADRSLDLTCPGLAEPSSRLARQLVIEAENWPPNSPEPNPVDYSAWGLATDGVITKFQTLAS